MFTTSSISPAKAAVLGVLIATSNVSETRANYQFVKVADTATLSPSGTPFTGFWLGAQSDGEVAFLAEYDGGVGIFTGGGGQLKTIAKSGDVSEIGAFANFGLPSINRGTVAFTGTNFFTSGVFTSTGGVTTTIAKKGDVSPAGILSSVGSDSRRASLVVNVGELTSFHAYVEEGSTVRRAILRGAGGPLTQIAKEGGPGPFGPIDGLGAQAMRDDDVIFTARSGADRGIYHGNGGAITSLLKAGDPAPEGTFSSFDDVASSGDNLAFFAQYSKPQFNIHQAIVSFDGTTTIPIFERFDRPPGRDVGAQIALTRPSISGNDVVFSVEISPTQGTDLLISRDGAPYAAVIQAGQRLFGEPLLAAVGNQFSLDPNGSGVIAFQYSLYDFSHPELPARDGIALAIPVPEPSALILIAASVAGMASAARPHSSKRLP